MLKLADAKQTRPADFRHQRLHEKEITMGRIETCVSRTLKQQIDVRNFPKMVQIRSHSSYTRYNHATSISMRDGARITYLTNT